MMIPLEEAISGVFVNSRVKGGEGAVKTMFVNKDFGFQQTQLTLKKKICRIENCTNIAKRKNITGSR